ncbi:MAG: NAD-dependent epimerase/dehydratase family protein [Candidatus Zixiibacteriota bacterium]
MKIFITGATGFIGTHLVKRLAQTDHKLVCLVRKTSDVGQLEAQGVTLITGDVTDKDSILKGMTNCHWVINLANIYSFWEQDKRIFALVNVEGTRNVMECALETGIAKVVHVSTVGIYGTPADSPFTEESPVGPVRFCEYFRTKYEGDLIAWELYAKKGLPLVMVYPVGVLGPDDPKATGKYIQNLIHRRLPATVFDDSVFTFVHVRDVAEIIVRAAERQNNIGEKYIAGRYQLTFGEINQMVSEISGVPLPKMRLPNALTMINARLLTWLADLIKKPPLWGMAIDQMKTMKAGVIADGSKAERELGITYTPIRVALEEAIASFQE